MNYGLLAAVIAGVILCVIPSRENSPSAGFWLLHESPGADPRWDPLVLFIDPRGRWHLDGEPVSAATLPDALRQRFGHRVDWSVLLDASPGVETGQVIRAMDVMAGIPARVILAPAVRSSKAVARRDVQATAMAN